MFSSPFQQLNWDRNQHLHDNFYKGAQDVQQGSQEMEVTVTSYLDSGSWAKVNQEKSDKKRANSDQAKSNEDNESLIEGSASSFHQKRYSRFIGGVVFVNAFGWCDGSILQCLSMGIFLLIVVF